jgi:Group II intron, maturase-specific domain/Reverse transcriptase (RNA-dependent DNA polymerase)
MRSPPLDRALKAEVALCVQSVSSPLLANIYLHPLDEWMARLGHRMVRYADDFVVLCESREAAEEALAANRDWPAANGLRLHPDKTHLGDCRNRGEGFDFLGYRFEAGGRFVRKKCLARLKDGIRQKTRRTRAQSLARIIDDLNPVLRGWFGYFKHANPNTFVGVDKFVRRRLRAVLRKQQKRPGLGRCLADHRRWPNAFFATAGLFALHTAWQTARHPRCGNHRLESRMRENRTYGSEGGEGTRPSRPLSGRAIDGSSLRGPGLTYPDPHIGKRGGRFPIGGTARPSPSSGSATGSRPCVQSPCGE